VIVTVTVISTNGKCLSLGSATPFTTACSGIP
jgi:hypothetical protein